MFENDYDTDEDSEVYFLKPVNEYNIVDKIKEANKELFDEGDSNSVSNNEQKRKVKFRTNLEDFEPNVEENTIGKDNVSNEDTSKTVCHIQTIEECVEDDDATLVDPNLSAIEECAEILANEVQKKIGEIEIQTPDLGDGVEEITEEIAEVIIDPGEHLDKDPIQPDKDCTSLPETNLENHTQGEGDSKFEEVLDDEDDDDLSIIVASYLPPEPEPPSDNESKSRSYSFSRHFSFRRKNTIRKPTQTFPEISSLKLNYKICCEYRNFEGIKLPRYTGYLSEYGLSRDQLDQREFAVQKRQKVVIEKNLKATESKMRKMQDNERAFITWLKNKMRFPTNKTKNMFDTKKERCSASSGRRSVFKPKFCGSDKSNIS